MLVTARSSGACWSHGLLYYLLHLHLLLLTNCAPLPPQPSRLGCRWSSSTWWKPVGHKAFLSPPHPAPRNYPAFVHEHNVKNAGAQQNAHFPGPAAMTDIWVLSLLGTGTLLCKLTVYISRVYRGSITLRKFGRRYFILNHSLGSIVCNWNLLWKGKRIWRSYMPSMIVWQIFLCCRGYLGRYFVILTC